MVPDWIYFSFIFATGCCIGSFLNVVIYRLPREKSLVFPGSACPHCDKSIAFYDNIPLVSWLVLRAKCRNCHAPVSARYFVIELLTGLAFLGLFWTYFRSGLRSDMAPFMQGGWLIFLSHLILLAVFIAASGIDLELWIIPLSLCWFLTGTALVAAVAGGYVLEPAYVKLGGLLPAASAQTGALAAGAGVGLVLSLVLMASGKLRRSYQGAPEIPLGEAGAEFEDNTNHRWEMLYEMLFLTPVFLGAWLVWWLTQHTGFATTWESWLHMPAVTGFLGALCGYFIGAGVVWATRILGTLAFGKEAMGLGDVHLMGAAGAVVGPMMVTVAFFVAPFFGLLWALIQMCSKKIRQIPYGPFLSIGTVVVMIFHDWILLRIQGLFLPM